MAATPLDPTSPTQSPHTRATPRDGRVLRAPATQLLGAVCVAFITWWAVHYTRDALAQFASIDWARAGKGDAAVDWSAAQLFWRHVSPYSPEGLQFVGAAAFGHPPTTPFWFLPLTELDHPTMAEVVGILNMGLALALIAIGVFTLRLPAPYAITALLFGFVQSLPPALEHARVIQISVWIAFAYVLAWRWLRNGRDVKAGCALGLACTLKFFPGVLVFYLLLCGRVRAVVAAGLSFLAVASIMTWRWGFDAWRLFFEQQGKIAQLWLGSVRNASLQGIIRRAFVAACEAHPAVPRLAAGLAVGSSLALLALSVWVARRARSRRDDAHVFDLSFCLFSVLSAFINPWIWEHYFYLLILPALVSWHLILHEQRRAFEAWRLGLLPFSRMALSGGRSLICVVPTALLWQATQYLYSTNEQARTAYCGYDRIDAVHDWLREQSEYLERLNWSPWPAFVLLFLGLLFAQRRKPASTEESARLDELTPQAIPNRLPLD